MKPKQETVNFLAVVHPSASRPCGRHFFQPVGNGLPIANDQIAQGTEQTSNQQQKITDLEKLLNTKNDELATANQELTGLRAAYAESKQNMLDLLQRLSSAQK